MLLAGLFLPGQSFALLLDTETLSKRIAGSLSKVASRKYATVAFSRISGPIDKNNVNELIDFTNVAMVRSRTFRVIDRSKLQLILNEQKFNLSGMVSQDTYKELGKLLGVDLFIYGRYYRDTLVMKAIDVESSAIVWGDIFQLGQLVPETVGMQEMAEKVNASLAKDLNRLKANNIRQISFWNINTKMQSTKLVDFLSVAITKAGHFQVVDRENLKLILEEQKLNQAEFIDENKAKRMGELYGVDAFIYGSISEKSTKKIASLKLLNIFNGVIEWADLIRFDDDRHAKGQSGGYGQAGSRIEENEMILIPGGKTLMGSNINGNLTGPEFDVMVESFYLDKREVSNAEYAVYLQRFKRRPPPHWNGTRVPNGKEDHPVVMVTWEDAELYCKAQGKRLPLEKEWEKAYRGIYFKIYPWGEKFEPNYARTVESGIRSALPVGERNQDVSDYGVMHMAGNVREWVQSSLQPYPSSRFRSSAVGREMVIRGGSWAENKFSARGYHRAHSKKTYAWEDVGFRCAR